MRGRTLATLSSASGSESRKNTGLFGKGVAGVGRGNRVADGRVATRLNKRARGSRIQF